jgi:four helix bundle protein
VGVVGSFEGVIVLAGVKDRARTRDFFRGRKKLSSLTPAPRDDRGLGAFELKEALMIIYDKALVIVRDVYRLARRVQRWDPDLARQMRRASSSVVLNLQEGMYSQGGHKVARYHNAMGSARETMACLHVCIAVEFVDKKEVEADLDRIDHVVAGLYRLCHRRRE